MDIAKDIFSKLTDKEVLGLKENFSELYGLLDKEIIRRKQPNFKYKQGECYACKSKFGMEYILRIEEVYDIDVYISRININSRIKTITYSQDSHETKGSFVKQYFDMVEITQKQFDTAVEMVNLLNFNLDSIMDGAYINMTNLIKEYRNGTVQETN